MWIYILLFSNDFRCRDHQTKVVVLEELYNFIVDNFSFESIYLGRITFEFITLEIQTFQITLDGEMTEPKVVDLDDIYNFVFNFFFV
jgi:hypothetical protein